MKIKDLKTTIIINILVLIILKKITSKI